MADLGVQTALDRIGGAGGTMVSLATSYHAGRFLQPGNPRRRVYFPQDGTVYYRPDPARWAGAVDAGVPVDEAQHIVAGLLDAALARELPQVQFPDFATRRIDAFADFPALYAFLQWRSQPITSLIAKIRSVVPPTTQLLLIAAEVF